MRIRKNRHAPDILLFTSLLANPQSRAHPAHRAELESNHMVKTTHVDFSDEIRTLATMRAAQGRIRLSEYLTRLVVADAENAGLLDYLDASPDNKQGSL